MRLNVNDWKPFQIQDIFRVKYGVNLELNNCEESDSEDAINFVSRCEPNNGISAKVLPIEGIAPLPIGLISVAGGGSSVLSTYVQTEPFYSGRDLYTLESKVPLSFESKIFITTIIEKNKYRYSFGRQANKTLPYIIIDLPVVHNDDGTPFFDCDKVFSPNGYVPDFQFMEDFIKRLHYRPLTTSNHNSNEIELNTMTWKSFPLISLFDVERGSITSLNSIEEGLVPIVSASGENEGISFWGNVDAPHCNNITISMNGVNTGFTSYHGYPFNINVDCCVLKQHFDMNKYVALFLVTVINQLKSKYSYGRKMSAERIAKESIKLPIQFKVDGSPVIDGTRQFCEEGYIPDWAFMESYVKSLPYGDRL